MAHYSSWTVFQQPKNKYIISQSKAVSNMPYELKYFVDIVVCQIWTNLDTGWSGIVIVFFWGYKILWVFINIYIHI